MSPNIHSASHREILERAIQKAVDGGWDEPLGMTPHEMAVDCTARIGGWQKEQIIFNHDFAKALWGESRYEQRRDGEGREYTLGPIEGWRFHLREMVIADDPIKYLGDNI